MPSKGSPSGTGRLEDPTPFAYDDDLGFQKVEIVDDAVPRIWTNGGLTCPAPITWKRKAGMVCRCRTKGCQAYRKRRRQSRHIGKRSLAAI